MDKEDFNVIPILNGFILAHQRRIPSDGEYDNLVSKSNASSGELGTCRSLNYVLVVTTIILIATTVYSAKRNLKS